MTEPSFAAELLDRLRREIEVDIETRSSTDTPPHRTIIWVVVDAADRVFIRSYRGATARWYREATSGTPTVLVIGTEVVPVAVEHASDEERIRACSAELERKYAGDPATPAMVRDEVLDTTLELRPAWARHLGVATRLCSDARSSDTLDVLHRRAAPGVA